jgi:hypothetical protein
MKNLMAGMTGISLCQIQFTNTHLELLIQLGIAITTGLFQWRLHKQNKNGSNKG